MSLRGFHIFFISFVTLFFAGVTTWAFLFGLQSNVEFWTPVAWVSLVTTIITPVYGVYFIRKSKHLYA